MMMGIHPNAAKHGIDSSVRYPPPPGDIDSMNKLSQSLPWWCPKLSRIKVVSAVVLIMLVMVVFTTYHLSIAYNSNIQQSMDVRQMIRSPGSADEEDQLDKIRAKHTKRRLPQCLIIGIRKAGTRALTTYLNLHPQISASQREIHFFDEDDKYSYGLEWYRKKMPYSYPEQITLEKTPAYFSTRVVPDRVYHMNSSIQLIVIVREPVYRTVSDYLQITIKKQTKNLETFSFEEMVLKENGEIDTKYPPLVRSVYYMYMENWLRKFDISQFHFVDGDRLIKDPLSELQGVEEFLGLEHRITENNFFFNESRGFYCIRNETREKCLADSKGRPHPEVDPSVMLKMKEFFQPYNERFFELIGRRFNWD